MRAAAWTFLVPFKDSRSAKSRLQLSTSMRRAVALAMLHDTVEQLSRLSVRPKLLVLCQRPDDIAAIADVPYLQVLRDTAHDLNEAIRRGERVARIADPDSWIAVCPADLPALVPQDLDLALAQVVNHPRSVVADHEGSGTTLLAASPSCALEPAYGPGSFMRHVAQGAKALELDAGSSLRLDVDNLDALEAVTIRAPWTRTSLIASAPRPESPARRYGQLVES